MRITSLQLVALSAMTVPLAAQQTPFPLPNTAPNTTSTELTAAWSIPARMTQTLVVDLNSLVANQGLSPTLTDWDMVAWSPDARYVFIPSEAGSGAGLFRYDMQTGAAVTFMLGNSTGSRESDPASWNLNNDDYSRFDPCTYTPFDTVLTGEETTGGRLFEVTNPNDPTGPWNVRWLSKVPAVAHEGTRFDAAGNLYVVDENNSGSIYKFVPTVPGDLTNGQSFVLVVDAYATDPNAVPSENYNSASNSQTSRIGAAHWEPLTDANGNAITLSDPFDFNGVNGGNLAANEVFGTPYGRPEDMDFVTLANGNECMLFTATSEDLVYSVEFLNDTNMIVRVFCDTNTIDIATGQPVGGTFNNPDNLTVDAWGAVYVIEDQGPGDIWKCQDVDNDGVAERIGRFVAQGVDGAEPTGMIFDPTDPYRFIACVQHPASNNDALWSFDTRPYPGSDLDLSVATGVDYYPNAGPGEWVRYAPAGSTVTLSFDSPNGSLYGKPFAALIQPFLTSVGQPSFLPGLWMNVFQPSFALVGGSVNGFPIVLPHGGGAVAVTVPGGLGGISIMLQGFGLDSSGALVLTDGVEVQF